MSPRRIPGLAAIAADFDIFLVDQFGVLHNGREPYRGAVAALTALREAGKRVALVSNSAKRAAPNAERMRRLGFADELYEAFVTSGEAAHAMLTAGPLRDRFGAAPRAIVFPMDRDRSFIEGTDILETDDVAAADLVIIAGSQAPQVTLADYRKRLEPLARRNLPALCLNPDKLMLVGGEMYPAPGRIAAIYEELGGAVTYIGKPYPEIYEAALARLGVGRSARVLGCGDSIEHDIAGARSIGAKSLLTLGGIFRNDPAEAIDEAIREHRVTPDFIAPLFAW
jgi:HAD superfamily hydrolase (TIGR01459 family)